MIRVQYGESRPLSRYPKEGKFRIITVDTFDGDDLAIDADTLEEAIKCAKKESGNMQKAYVYFEGDLIHEFGTF